jgi:hypothetical protein
MTSKFPPRLRVREYDKTLSFQAKRPLGVTLDRVFDLGLTAILDAFQTANELIEMTELSVRRFDVRMAGLRKAVKTAQGLRVPVHGVEMSRITGDENHCDGTEC